MLHSLVHRLTKVGHRRSRAASASGRGQYDLARTAALRATLLCSLLVIGVVTVGLAVLYTSVIFEHLVIDLLIWFGGVVAILALPSLVLRVGRSLYR